MRSESPDPKAGKRRGQVSRVRVVEEERSLEQAKIGVDLGMA